MRHRLSQIEIQKVEAQNGLIGFANFIVDGKFGFRSIAIFTRAEGGIRLSWPERQVGTKRIKTASPIKPESFNDIEAQIFEVLNKEEKYNEKKNNHNSMPGHGQSNP